MQSTVSPLIKRGALGKQDKPQDRRAGGSEPGATPAASWCGFSQIQTVLQDDLAVLWEAQCLSPFSPTPVSSVPLSPDPSSRATRVTMCWRFHAKFCKVSPLPTGWKVNCFVWISKPVWSGPWNTLLSPGLLATLTHPPSLGSSVFSPSLRLSQPFQAYLISPYLSSVFCNFHTQW